MDFVKFEELVIDICLRNSIRRGIESQAHIPTPRTLTLSPSHPPASPLPKSGGLTRWQVASCK